MPTRLFRSARRDRKRFVVLYVVLVAGLLLAAAAFVWEARVIVRDGAMEEEAFTVLGVANRALDDLQDAETGQRGYLVTGSPEYLQPYDRGIRDVEEATRLLRQFVATDPPSLEILRRIDALRESKLVELARTIALARDGDRVGAIALVNTGRGKREMDRLRAEFDRLRGRWEARRHRAADEARDRVLFGAGALGVFAIFVGGLLVYALIIEQRAFANISAYSEAMDREAGCDPLTGLPNRRRVLAQIDALASRPDSSTLRVALLFMDIDGFKRVNDVLGHSAGDAFLRRLAQWLSAVVRRDDMLARVGGDEFVALVTHYAGDEDLRQLARRLIGQVQAVAHAEYAGRFDIGLSVGIATFPDRVRHLRQLIDAADAAMYAAKGEESSTFRFASAAKNESEYAISARKYE